MSQNEFGATAYDRERQLKGGGCRVVTILDVQAQRGAGQAVRKAKSETARQAAMVAVVETTKTTTHAKCLNQTSSKKVFWWWRLQPTTPR